MKSLLTKDIEAYIFELLDEAGSVGADSSSDADRQTSAEELAGRLDSYIMSVIATALSKPRLKEFLEMNKSHSQIEIEAFLQDNIPMIDALIQKALSDFRDIYLFSQKS